jgi:hypothetical protein
MKAGEWKCPECGAGFRNVALDYWVGPDRVAALWRTSESAVHGTCTNGHEYIWGWKQYSAGPAWRSMPVRRAP